MSARLQRRYLSLWLRRLATDRIVTGCVATSCHATSRLAHSPACAPGEPLVVTRLVKGALRIVAMDDAAQSLGLRPGMPLADARAMYPALAVAESDEEADRRLIDAVADWCDRYTPLVGLDAPDGLVLDIAGCAHLFGGEAALCHDILARLADQGLHARAAIADTVGCAFAVARFVGAFLVPPGGMRHALAPLPMAALRLIADVIDLPRAPLAARFGEILVRRLDQALGREDEPITPRLPVPSYVAEQNFPDPIGLERDVLGAIARLAAQLDVAMERRQDGARLLQIALFRADNKVYRIEVGTGAPVRDAAHIARLFADRLAMIGDACDPGFGFDMVRLAALVTERCEPVQSGLAQRGSMRNGFLQDGFDCSGDDAAFSHLIDRLGARHIPEFAVAAQPAHAVKHEKTRRVETGLKRGNSSRSQAALSPSPLVGEGRGGGSRGECMAVLHPTTPTPDPSPQGGGEKQDSLSPTRPVRLFDRPEPVEAVAEVPDGPPARFRWRRVLHEVAAAEGPERIAMEWWRDADGQALTRDYFRVESREGLRVWLYREGLYGCAAPAPRWFLHGLFG